VELSIKSHDLELSDALKAYTERRLRGSLLGFAERLESVEVRLSDVNGPRGGADKNCAIRVILRQLGVVFARAKGRHVYSTVDCAASRLRSALVRRLGRRRADRRRARWISTAATGERGLAE
jgi:ribosome hibernation promoting factor